jgi:hypothetical protein
MANLPREDYEVALQFLRNHGHAVGEFHPQDGKCNVDGEILDAKGLMVLASTYGKEWLGALEAECENPNG